MKRYLNIEVAVREYCKKTNTIVKSIRYTNKGRHIVLVTENKGVQYIKFDRELFYSFGKIFNTSGAGETINLGVLKRMIHSGIRKLVFLFEQGGSYWVDPIEFYQECKQFIRVTSSGETTISCPVSFLKPIS